MEIAPAKPVNTQSFREICFLCHAFYTHHGAAQSGIRILDLGLNDSTVTSFDLVKGRNVGNHAYIGLSAHV
jgi:hypothetical protein